VTVAEDQAASITHEAWEQAAAIRQAAEQEAVAIRQQATDHAAAIREAAEREAAELKAALLAMSGELGRVATFVTDNLSAPALPGTRPFALPPPRPAIEPGALPASMPLAPPATRPTRRPETKPDIRPAKPGGKPRQLKAFHVATVAAAGLVAFAVVLGSAELAHNGFRFFVFRAGNTGETAGNETDQQFIASQQPHRAPAAHHTVVAHHAPAKKGRHALEAGHTSKSPKK
jgi:hypothetical protein